ncbi:M48 family metalloprotease [Allobranchiibius sp. CTAmp26]|uniref:M48 family metalloprotease n=1 Tax=Allobranchiibius sp. CTAmp26 TaxID=2815214 RepID=UPI001AA0F157|nr:M48 family metalloprotease [Allobranchiibius sp. CTAmp26]MBO1756870.1 M48 family metalloprotease [Allobranchiibius sp. CTAmp26]
MGAATRAQVEEVIAKLVPVPVHVRWVPGSADSGANTDWRGRHVIKFGDSLLCNADQAFFFAAHEAGHIALGHTRWQTKLTTMLLFLSGASVVLLAAGLLVAQFNLAAGSWAWLGLLLVLHLVLRLRYPHRELDADDFAQDHGHSIIGITSDAARGWQHELLLTHPRWDQRQAHARRVTQ